jgi:glycosidase
MLDGDPRRIKMAYSLMFALPGTPTLFYGEEIGMGENLDIEGRMAVRSPMQWSPERNGGFTTAAPSRLRRPVVEGAFGPEHVNVADQRGDPDSLLEFVSLLIRRYRESPELGWADFTILDQPHRSVLAHDSRWDDRRMIAVHNLSPEPRTVPLQLTDCEPGSHAIDLLEEGKTEIDETGRVEVAMDGYGYRWLRVVQPDGRRLA